MHSDFINNFIYLILGKAKIVKRTKYINMMVSFNNLIQEKNDFMNKLSCSIKINSEQKSKINNLNLSLSKSESEKELLASKLSELDNSLNIHKKKLSVPYTSPSKTFKNLICVTGFGHSGSGVVLDILREVKDFTVVGFCDKESFYHRNCGDILNEFDFLRTYGGVFDLENAFKTSYGPMQNIYLLNFIQVIENLYSKEKGVYGDEFYRLSREFINEIVNIKIPYESGNFTYPSQCFYNDKYEYKYLNLEYPFNLEKKEKNYYFLKHITYLDYRKIAHNYINKFLKTINSNTNLVIDQFTSDGKLYNQDFFDDYLGEHKQIFVYRDPRDVYSQGILTNSIWIPSEPIAFVDWYMSFAKSLKNLNNDKNTRIYRFEDLVLNYEKSVSDLFAFLNVPEINHINKKKSFNPRISKNNIGLYRLNNNLAAINYIGDKLIDFCFN